MMSTPLRTVRLTINLGPESTDYPVSTVDQGLVGTLIGGWLGTLLILRLSPKLMRALVIAVGVGTTIKLALGD